MALAADERKELAIIDAFSPGLANTPGWAALSREKQDRLLQHTSNLIQYSRLEARGALGACIELAQIESELTGEKLTITAYIKTLYRNSERTAWRRLADYKELRKHWPDKVIETVAVKGEALLRGASGIAVKELINVARTLPPPSSKDEKVIEGYVQHQVRDELRKRRTGRSEGQPVKLNEEEAAKIAFNTVLRIMRNLRSLKTSAQDRHWLARVFGWLMEARGVPGTARVGRIPIPEGMVIRRGRPRGSTKKKSS